MGQLIWVVDDDEGILEVTEIVLREAGYTVMKINSEKKFRSNLKRQLPNLILLDIRISGMDGKEIATQMKSNPKTQRIPIIMMSGDIDLPEKSREARADAYLKKPYDIGKLEQIVKDHIK